MSHAFLTTLLACVVRVCVCVCSLHISSASEELKYNNAFDKTGKPAQKKEGKGAEKDRRREPEEKEKKEKKEELQSRSTTCK